MSRFETGEENAARFVRAVGRVAQEQRHVCFTIEPLSGSERGGWVWMQNKEWRVYVFDLLNVEPKPVKFPTFHKPDHLDGWTFSGLSNAPQHKVETLALQDTLAGPAPSSRVTKMVSIARPWGLILLWWALGLGFLVLAIYAGMQV